MFRWLSGRGAPRRDIERTAASIPPDAWARTLAAYPFLRRLSEHDAAALRQRTAWMLASKSFVGAAGLTLTDDMLLSIAVQAALPVLALDPALYEGWREIIVYPGGFIIPRKDTDADGVVHEYLQEAAGEAWEGGPVILSWEDARTPGHMNVVIHEFAHKLDLHDGMADGQPDLSRHRELSPRRWRTVLDDSYARFCEALEAIENDIPADMDPESAEADAWYGQLPLDPYAASDEAEFFAVSSETFFVDPAPLAHALPDWFDLLRAYYRQNPLTEAEAAMLSLPSPAS